MSTREMYHDALTDKLDRLEKDNAELKERLVTVMRHNIEVKIECAKLKLDIAMRNVATVDDVD